MEETRFDLPDHLILARQGSLLRTFFKLVATLTAVALVLIAFLPGFATADDIREPFLRNIVVLIVIGGLYYLVDKGYVLASIYGTIAGVAIIATYTIYMESPGNMQMLTLIIFPTCVAGLLPTRRKFWSVYAINLGLILFVTWLIISYRGVELENRSIVTVAMLHILIALLIDTLSSSYRDSLRTTFNQLLKIEAAEQLIEQMDVDLGLAVSEKQKAEFTSSRLARTGELALEVVGGASIAINPANDFVEMSPGFLERFGFNSEPITYGKFCDLIHQDDRARFITLVTKASESGERMEADMQISAGGPLYWMFMFEPSPDSGDQVTLNGIVVDVTSRVLEQRRLSMEESKQHESQRLESLGVLAGSIAHDFNNLLHVIMLNADLARHELKPDSRSATSIDRVMTTVQRAADLCSELLAYSGRGSLSLESFNVIELVEDMQNLLDISTPKGVTLQLSDDGTNPRVDGDVTQIRQVVMNLITNAGDAIGNNPRGVIEVTVSTEECDSELFDGPDFIEQPPAGTFAVITIRDNGSGMDESTKLRMFDPFFTTRETGHGLGLSAVLGIIRGHHGSVRIESEQGVGSSISVFLPVSSEPLTKEEDVPVQASTQDGKLILFVDDEPEIRQLARIVLEESGYQVIDAAGGQEAIDLFIEHSDTLQLVILDLIMPGKTGLEAYLEINDYDSSVPVVFSSGFNESEILNKLPPKARSSFLKKPYIAKDLQIFVDGIIGPRD